MEVKHTQGSDTTYLYPTNTREESHRSKVRKGVVYLSFFGGSLFWGSYSSSFGRNVLLG